ncbi:hypothetical protein D3C77_430280 [compost metagenome]
MSEYGFQSFPELNTVLKYAPEDQLELESKIMLAHQKNGRGNQLIKEYMGQYLPEPRDFKSFLYMSQILQAQAIQTAIEAHRRHKPYCMGTLYWQINDCWPVASWAGMDYYGRWKALQYTVRRSFRDVLMSIVGTHDSGVYKDDSHGGDSHGGGSRDEELHEGEAGPEVAIHIISDRQYSAEGVLKLMLYDFSGQLLYESVRNVTIGANVAEEALTIRAKELLGDHDPKNVVLLAKLEQDDIELDSKHYYFESLREISWPQPTIMVEEVAGSDGTTFTLKTDALARQVWLSAEEEGIFSDNFFDLIPGIPYTVSFRRRSSGEEAFIPGKPGALAVRSMKDFII